MTVGTRYVLAHLMATLSSCALATIVSMQARRICSPSSWSMDVLGLLLILVQMAAMCLPYVGYHKAGGPILFPPISCANNYTWLRLVGTWLAFTLLAGGMHAWTALTHLGNRMQIPEVIAVRYFCIPSAGLVLLAGNPVPLRDYTTAFVARGTEAAWLVPAAFSHNVSKQMTIYKGVTRLLMAGHLLGALVLIVAPLVGGFLRAEWYTKLCASFHLALLMGCHSRLPIYRLASYQLDAKVTERFTGCGATHGWKNELNSPQNGRELWKLINKLGVLEHLLLNALMVVILSYQRYTEVHGLVGWASRGIALLWNVGFATWGGKWWLTKLLEHAITNRYSEPHSIGLHGTAQRSPARAEATLQPRVAQPTPSRSPVRRTSPLAKTAWPARRPRTREAARQHGKAAEAAEHRYNEELREARRAPSSVLPYGQLMDWEARNNEGLSNAARHSESDSDRDFA